MDDTLMMWPDPCASILGSTAAMPCRTPRMLTSIIRFHSSTFSAASGDSGITPALLTSTSTRPNSVSANRANASMSSRLVTSRARNRAEPPACSICPARVSRRSTRRAPQHQTGAGGSEDAGGCFADTRSMRR